KDQLNDKITSRREVERLIDVPISGEVGHSDNSGTLQIKEGDHSVIAETFRLVRENLNLTSLGKENKVILVTSSHSCEGKSFFSVNFLARLDLSCISVDILDFELRRANLLKSLVVP